MHPGAYDSLCLSLSLSLSLYGEKHGSLSRQAVTEYTFPGNYKGVSNEIIVVVSLGFVT